MYYTLHFIFQVNIDKYGKVRLLIAHLQKQFGEVFQPEQNLSHDETMVKYFGKHSLKQSIMNKPIRFGFKAWCMCTPLGQLVSFDFYQGNGIGKHHSANKKAVGASSATVLDLIDLIPLEKKNFPYHFFADNYFSSNKLVEVLLKNGYNYTGTLRQDRLKGVHAITPNAQFKKNARGFP